MTCWKCLVSLLFSVFVAQVAQADDHTSAKEQAAKTACLAGDYAKGVAILSELYVKTNNAVLLFNQGRCFEQNHRCEDAISRFQEYLRVGKRISSAHKADTQKHIVDCRNLLVEQSTAATAVATGTTGNKEARERAARKACLTGDPVAGVGILADLFIDTHDTTYLFNQGRCFEQNRRYEDAIGRFREYLMKAKNLSPEDKADTQKHISACESYSGAKPAAPPNADAPKTAVETPTTPAPRPNPILPVATVAQPRPVRAGAALRTTGLVIASLGGAALITGLVLNVRVNGMSTELENEYDPSVDSDRKSYKTAMWVGYGAGAACLVGGAIVYYLGWRRGEGTASLALVPTLGPDVAGTALSGRF
jgi:tetratricopeptide (TPR) repeat protein